MRSEQAQVVVPFVVRVASVEALEQLQDAICPRAEQPAQQRRHPLLVRLAQLALAWVLRDARVTSALIGASSVAQLEQNVAALDRLDFDPAELEEIERYQVAHLLFQLFRAEGWTLGRGQANRSLGPTELELRPSAANQLRRNPETA